MTWQFLERDGSPTEGETTLEALKEAQTPVVCWVEDSEILWKTDASRVLHEFAIWCAEEGLKTVEDPEALRIKKLWIDGRATNEELGAARQAAWETAGDATKGEEWGAAWYTAWYAMGDIAVTTARDTAWYSATAASWNAAETEQNRELERRLNALMSPPTKRSRWEALLDDNPV